VGKKRPINGNGVSTNMAGDEEELTRSYSRKRKYYLRSNKNNFAARFLASGKLRLTREAEMRRVISDAITQSGQASLKCVDQSFRFQIKTSNAVPSSFHRVYR
jgi:hypothetical protein